MTWRCTSVTYYIHICIMSTCIILYLCMVVTNADYYQSHGISVTRILLPNAQRQQAYLDLTTKPKRKPRLYSTELNDREKNYVVFVTSGRAWIIFFQSYQSHRPYIFLVLGYFHHIKTRTKIGYVVLVWEWSVAGTNSLQAFHHLFNTYPMITMTNNEVLLKS